MVSGPNNNEPTLREHLRVIFKYQRVIAVTVVVMVLAVLAGFQCQLPSYQAEVKMLVSAQKQIESSYYRDVMDNRQSDIALTQSEIVESLPVLERAVLALGLDKRTLADEKLFAPPIRRAMFDLMDILGPWGERIKDYLPATFHDENAAMRLSKAIQKLKRNIKVEAIKDTGLFYIQVKDYDPVMAARIANAVSRSYVIFDLEQQLVELNAKFGEKHPMISQLRDEVDAMTKNLSGERLTDMEAIGPASVKIIEQAAVPLKPAGLPKSVTLLLAVVMSTFMGVLFAYIFEYTDQTIKSPQDIEQILSMPYLGSIRRKRTSDQALIDFRKKLSPYGHSYQSVSDHLHVLMKEKGVASFIITATLNSEGVSVVAANIANYLSHFLRRGVLLIDADMRIPNFHALFNIPNEKGLADYLDEKADLKSVIQKVSAHLSVLPAGSTSLNPILLFESKKFDELIRMAKENFDLVIIRASSMSNHKDLSVLAKHVEGLLVVVEEGKVRRQVIRNALEPLNGKASNALGVLLINRTYPIPRWIYERI